LIKAGPADLSVIYLLKNYGFKFIKAILTNPQITSIVVFSFAGFIVISRHQKKFWSENKILTVIFLAATAIHLTMARTGWFYRYEAYLCALGIFVMMSNLTQCLRISKSPKDTKSVIRFYIGALIVVFILNVITIGGLKKSVSRTISTIRTPIAIKNIHEQQYQMGLFCREFYSNQCVALNDIGAVSFLAGRNILDLYGLANPEVVKAKMNGTYSTTLIRELSKKYNAKIAIVYDAWFQKDEKLPEEWIKIAYWKINHNVVCSDDQVTFYAIDKKETERLITNLEEFSKNLPPDVLYEQIVFKSKSET